MSHFVQCFRMDQVKGNNLIEGEQKGFIFNNMLNVFITHQVYSFL